MGANYYQVPKFIGEASPLKLSCDNSHLLFKHNKCSLLKLFYSLESLYKGTPFNHLDLTSLELSFSCIFAHNFYLSILRSGQKNKWKDTQIPWAFSAPQPAYPGNIAPPPAHLPIISRQDNHHAGVAPSRFAARLLDNISLPFSEIVSPCNQNFLPWLLPQRERGVGRGVVIWVLIPTGGQRRDDNDGENCPAAAAPALSAKRGGITWVKYRFWCAFQR